MYIKIDHCQICYKPEEVPRKKEGNEVLLFVLLHSF